MSNRNETSHEALVHTEVTRVVFRVFPEGDVVALFVDCVNYPDGCIESYQHIGQHGAASPSLQFELPEATPEEYSALYQELTEVIGYNLEVVNE